MFVNVEADAEQLTISGYLLARFLYIESWVSANELFARIVWSYF
jgi:hypothetical protein